MSQHIRFQGSFIALAVQTLELDLLYKKRSSILSFIAYWRDRSHGSNKSRDERGVVLYENLHIFWTINLWFSVNLQSWGLNALCIDKTSFFFLFPDFKIKQQQQVLANQEFNSLSWVRHFKHLNMSLIKTEWPAGRKRTTFSQIWASYSACQKRYK